MASGATATANEALSLAPHTSAAHPTEAALPKVRLAKPLHSGKCPACGNSGYVRVAGVPFGHPLFGRALECPDCRLVSQWRLERYKSLSGAVGDLHLWTFDNFNLEEAPGAAEAYQAAQDFAANPQGWLAIFGRPGNGKSHLAAAVNNHLEAQGQAVLFVVVPDLLDHLRSTFAPGSETTYSELFEAVREVPVLILDDIGAESPTNWALEKLYQLLDHRTVQHLATMLTSNLMLEEFEPRLRSRIENRLLGRVVINEAADYRRRARTGRQEWTAVPRLNEEETS